LTIFSGLTYGAGFLVNYTEIGGRFSGMVFGLSNTIGTLSGMIFRMFSISLFVKYSLNLSNFKGIIAPYLVGLLTVNVSKKLI